MMSVVSVLERTIEQTVPIVGSKIILTYGPHLLRKIYRKKTSTSIYSVLVFNFFSREEYEKVYGILMNEIENFRKKEDNKNVLHIGDWKFDYNLSISLAQDDLMIANLLEDFYYDAYLTTEPFEEKIDTTLIASSARLFLTPRLRNKELELNEFKKMLESLLEFYRSIDKKMLNYMKGGTLGSTKMSLHIILIFEEESFLKSRKFNTLLDSYSSERIDVDLKSSKIHALIDDTSVIEALVKLLR